MSLLKLCHWLAATRLGILMRDSTWDFAIVEVVHLLALAVFGGAVLLVNLRFLNLAFKTQPISRVARELLPLTAGGVVVMVVTGFLLVANGPVRYYYNPAFRLKMILFVVALVVHFSLQLNLIYRVPNTVSKLNKTGALLSLLLWLSIGVAGRAIGYV